MRIERALDIRRHAIERVNDVFATAIICGVPSSALHADICAVLRNLPRGTPSHVVAYVNGYTEAKRAELYRSHLVFGGMVDGVFRSTHSDRADYYGAHGIAPAAYADNGAVKSRGHYWKHNLRPFFI